MKIRDIELSLLKRSQKRARDALEMILFIAIKRGRATQQITDEVKKTLESLERVSTLTEDLSEVSEVSEVSQTSTTCRRSAPGKSADGILLSP
jgi:hypothetical protein